MKNSNLFKAGLADWQADGLLRQSDRPRPNVFLTLPFFNFADVSMSDRVDSQPDQLRNNQ